jgi:hypothetical protein
MSKQPQPPTSWPSRGRSTGWRAAGPDQRTCREASSSLRLLTHDTVKGDERWTIEKPCPAIPV